MCTRHQLRSVTTTVVHVFGHPPKPSHDRRGNPSDSDLHAFARCSLPHKCVDAVTAAQTFNTKNAIRFENKLLQQIVKLFSRFRYQKRCQFWGHECCHPRAQYYIPNINKTWNHFTSLNWEHFSVPNLGSHLHSVLFFFVRKLRQFGGARHVRWLQALFECTGLGNTHLRGAAPARIRVIGSGHEHYQFLHAPCLAQGRPVIDQVSVCNVARTVRFGGTVAPQC